MRRLRAGFAPPHSGGRGSPSGPTTGLCLQWLDADRERQAKARRSAVPEARSPGHKRRGGAPTGAATHRKMDRVSTTHPRLSARRSPHGSRGGLPQSSGASRRETASAWLFDIQREISHDRYAGPASHVHMASVARMNAAISGARLATSPAYCFAHAGSTPAASFTCAPCAIVGGAAFSVSIANPAAAL